MYISLLGYKNVIISHKYYLKKNRNCFIPECSIKLLISETRNVKKYGCIKGRLPGVRQVLATESCLKLMKNAFYITLKALFVLLIRKIRLISRFLTSQPGLQTITLQTHHVYSRWNDVKRSFPHYFNVECK